MFPLEGTFHRFQRMARDLACQQNKRIRVNISGLDTELDKEVIEVITDPMKHLVRNCLDHGIEPPEERRAKGKAAQGIIEFKAYQNEGRICIEIADDGRGIDWDAVRQKALAMGWMQAEQAASPDTLLDILFRPGLSTSSLVTEISGRGIGMDVVRSQLDQLKGSIQIHTEKDKGTRFILSLPLTFALMEALHVKVRGASYLLPLHAIVGTEKFCEELVTTMAAGEQLVRLRGAYVPLFIWNRLLQRSTPPVRQHGPVLVFLDTRRRTFAISVDEVLEPQQIIVKSLEVNFRSVRGVAGAAIMGDGSVALVLDVLGIEEMLFKTRGKVDAAKSCV
jgi:two-component system chemotaxis sensor kinase CheA